MKQHRIAYGTRRAGLGLGGAWIVAAGLMGPSCSSPGKGAIVLAVSTDMQTPKDIDIVSVYVSTSGTPKFDYLGRVLPNGTVSLPSTLAVVEPDDPSAEVRIRVVGFQSVAGAEQARVARDVLTTVPHQSTVLLRIPLSFLDEGSASGTLPAADVPRPGGAHDGATTFDPTGKRIHTTCDFAKKQTMVAGTCTDAHVDSSKLAAYKSADVFGDAGLRSDGTAAGCFNVAQCFATAAPVAGVDLQHCKFTLPAGADASRTNLALETPATGDCVGAHCFVPLENDTQGGWSAQGSSVTMVPGVCKRMQAGAGLYQAAPGACAPKAEARPVCQLVAGSDGGTYDAGVEAAVEAAAEAAVDAPPEAAVEAGCSQGQLRCSNTSAGTPELCDDTGTWQPQPACQNQACVNGACVGACTPGAMQCTDRVTPALCDATGTPVPQAACTGTVPFCYQGACVTTFPSCQGASAGTDLHCGAASSSDCCASPAVTGGAFNRDNQTSYPATIAGLRLDAFEVTVGRFRKFVSATAPGSGTPWVPAAGSGKHGYLPGGGLLNTVLPEGGTGDAGSAGADSGTDGAAAVPVYESGWDPAWETLPSTEQAWANALVCDGTYSTWSLASSTGDALPINCVTWAEAEAFCIWDGGFLPSEAEWAYAASGGATQNQYPWGNTAPASNAALANYGCYFGGTGNCTGLQNIAPVGSIPAGDATLAGQSDMAGNVSEWLLDWYASSYSIATCANCASTAPATTGRSVRGGAFYDTSSTLSTATRSSLPPGDRGANLGFRCARPPSGASQ